MREGDKDVLLSAGARDHVLLLRVKLVVAALGASDQLGEGVVLAINDRRFSEMESVHGDSFLNLNNFNFSGLAPKLLKIVLFFVLYQSRDERQGAGVISNRDKFVTFGQIPVEANVRCNAPSAVDGVAGVALAMDGGLKLVNGGKL